MRIILFLLLCESSLSLAMDAKIFGNIFYCECCKRDVKLAAAIDQCRMKKRLGWKHFSFFFSFGSTLFLSAPFHCYKILAWGRKCLFFYIDMCVYSADSWRVILSSLFFLARLKRTQPLWQSFRFYFIHCTRRFSFFFGLFCSFNNQALYFMLCVWLRIPMSQIHSTK